MVIVHVDRIEGEWAVVLAGEDEIQLPSSWLPEGSGEGSVVQVEMRSASSAETALSDAVSARLKRLEGADDGDDFSL